MNLAARLVFTYEIDPSKKPRMISLDNGHRGAKTQSKDLGEYNAPLLCNVVLVNLVSHCRMSSKVRLILRPVSRAKGPI